MRLLYDLRDDIDNPKGTPLELWVKKHGKRTLEKFSHLKEENGFVGPVPFVQDVNEAYEVYIDPEYNVVDKLSQVNQISIGVPSFWRKLVFFFYATA